MMILKLVMIERISRFHLMQFGGSRKESQGNSNLSVDMGPDFARPFVTKGTALFLPLVNLLFPGLRAH